MLAVLAAVFAVGMGGYAQYRRLRRLSQEYGRRAASHDQTARAWSSFLIAERGRTNTEKSLARAKTFPDVSDDEAAQKADLDRYESFWRPRVALWKPRVEREKAMIAHHYSMAVKYRRAPASPWLPVASDSPEP
jgi:hypothetical protein